MPTAEGPIQPTHLSIGQPKMGAATQSAFSILAKDQKIPEFDPRIHLNFKEPSSRYSFAELGLEKPHNAPDVCYTEPFQLFSEEGIRVMRQELFRKEFLHGRHKSMVLVRTTRKLLCTWLGWEAIWATLMFLIWSLSQPKNKQFQEKLRLPSPK